MTRAGLQLEAVEKRYATRAGEVRALDATTVDIRGSEFVSIVGPSGCGKSTLLMIVAGLLGASSGTVLVDGRPVAAPGPDRGVVFQTYTLFPWLTATQNVEFALQATGSPRQERRGRARELMRLVGLEDFADAYPRELSGGMKQRVAIARSLSYRPRLLLMDEPFGALDSLTRQNMQALLSEIWEQEQLTVLFITHDVDEAVFLSDRVLIMTRRPGRIKEEVAIDLPRPRHPDVLTSTAFLQPKRAVMRSIHAEVG